MGGDWFPSERERGSWLNWARLRTSDVQPGTTLGQQEPCSWFSGNLEDQTGGDGMQMWGR